MATGRITHNSIVLSPDTVETPESGYSRLYPSSSYDFAQVNADETITSLPIDLIRSYRGWSTLGHDANMLTFQFNDDYLEYRLILGLIGVGPQYGNLLNLCSYFNDAQNYVGLYDFGRDLIAVSTTSDYSTRYENYDRFDLHAIVGASGQMAWIDMQFMNIKDITRHPLFYATASCRNDPEIDTTWMNSGRFGGVCRTTDVIEYVTLFIPDGYMLAGSKYMFWGEGNR